MAYHEPSASLRNQVISRLKNIAKLHENLVINIVCEMGNQQRLRVANDLVEMIKAAKISVKLSTEQTFFVKPPPPIRMVYNPNNEDLFQKVISALEIYMGGKATRIREKEMLPSAMSLEFYGLPIFLNSTRVGFH